MLLSRPIDKINDELGDLEITDLIVDGSALVREDLTVSGRLISQAQTVITNLDVSANFSVEGNTRLNTADISGYVSASSYRVGNRAINTSDISENITGPYYFTQERARQSLTAGTNINYDISNGTISVDPVFSSLTAGALGVGVSPLPPNAAMAYIKNPNNTDTTVIIESATKSNFYLNTPSNQWRINVLANDDNLHFFDEMADREELTINRGGDVVARNSFEAPILRSRNLNSPNSYWDIAYSPGAGLLRFLKDGTTSYFSLNNSGLGTIQSLTVNDTLTTTNMKIGTLSLADYVRGSVSAGSGLSYDSNTGVFTNTFTQAAARASISATVVDATDGSYNSSTGVMSLPRNYWSLNTSTNKTSNTRDLVITNPIEIGLEDQGRWLYRGYGTNGVDQYGIGQWTNGRVRTFTPSYGSSGYSVYNSNTQQITDVFKVEYDGYGSLYGTATLTLKNTGTNGGVCRLWDVNEAGYNLWQDRTNDRFKVSKKSGGTILDILALSSSGELGLGQGIAPKAGYSVYAEKPLSIKVGNGDCLFLEGTDMFNGNPSTINFKSGSATGYLQYTDIGGGNFIINKPLTIAGKCYPQTLQVDGGTTLAAATVNGNAVYNGEVTFNYLTTFNYEQAYAQPVHFTTNDMSKWIYKAYGNYTSDLYGVGQTTGGQMRMFTSSGNTSPYLGFSTNLGLVYNDQAGQFLDQIRTQWGKTSILSIQDMTLANLFSSSYFPNMKWKEPTNGTGIYDAALKVHLQAARGQADVRQRTFQTVCQNLGRTTANVFEENEWAQSVRYTLNDTQNRWFESGITTRYHPTGTGLSGNQTVFNQWQDNVGERVGMRILFTQSGLGGNNGTNYSNIVFPQLARNIYVNAYFSPDGYLYPDVYSSDERLKRDVRSVEPSILDEFRGINIVNYFWNPDGDNADVAAQHPRITQKDEQIGIIAQDVLAKPTIQDRFKIVHEYQFSSELPSGKNTNPIEDSHFVPEKTFLTLNKDNLHFLNMRAIQETNDRVDNIEQHINNLGSAEVEGLRNRVSELENENESLKQRLTDTESLLASLIKRLKDKFVI